MLKVTQVAERLNCSIATVYALVASGELAAFHIGPKRGGIRIAPEDLEAYLASVRKGGAKERPAAPRPRLKNLTL